MRGRRVILAALGGSLLTLAVSATASAHGLVQRANLPIPEELFLWAAAIVLVVSFVALGALWPQPRLEQISWRPLPGGRALGSRPVEIVLGAVGVALFAIVVWAGLAGKQGPQSNLAPTFILITFWVGMAFACAFFGDLFRPLNPWRAIGRVLSPLFGAPREYPERWGRWPAAIALTGFTWIELASDWGEHPRYLAIAALLYAAAMVAGYALYGVEQWDRRGDGFAVYFNLIARISPFESRDGVVGVRPLLGGLPKLDPVPGTVAFVAVMIGTVTYDGLSQGPLWKEVGGWLDDRWADLGVGFSTGPVLTATVGLFVGIALVAAFYHLGIKGARSVGGDIDVAGLRSAFVHSLVPIAFVYVAAHYLTFLLFEGQAIGYLASDPLGHGWNLFGSAQNGIDYSVISQNGAWYTQVGFVVAGHVAALILAHDRALALYRDARTAVRSQYWMLAIMIGFTTLALWLLSKAGT